MGKKRNSIFIILLIIVLIGVFGLIYYVSHNSNKNVKVSILQEILVVDKAETSEELDALIRNNISVENGSVKEIITSARTDFYGEYPVKVIVSGVDGKTVERTFTVIITEGAIDYSKCEKIWVVDKEAWTEEKYVVDVPYQAEKGHYETVVVKEAVPEKGHYEDAYIVDVPYQPAVEEKGHYEQKWVVDSPAVAEKGHYETKVVHHDGVHHPAETHEETVYEIWNGYQASVATCWDWYDDDGNYCYDCTYEYVATVFLKPGTDINKYFRNIYGDDYDGYRQTGEIKKVEAGTKTIVDKEAWDEPAWDEETQVWVVDTPAQEEKGHYEEEYVVDQPAKPEVKEQGHHEQKWIVDSPAIPAVTEQKYVKDTDEIAEQGHYEKIEHEEVGHYEFIEC